MEKRKICVYLWKDSSLDREYVWRVWAPLGRSWHSRLSSWLSEHRLSWQIFQICEVSIGMSTTPPPPTPPPTHSIDFNICRDISTTARLKLVFRQGKDCKKMFSKLKECMHFSKLLLYILYVRKRTGGWGRWGMGGGGKGWLPIWRSLRRSVHLVYRSDRIAVMKIL